MPRRWCPRRPGLKEDSAAGQEELEARRAELAEVKRQVAKLAMLVKDRKAKIEKEKEDVKNKQKTVHEKKLKLRAKLLLKKKSTLKGKSQRRRSRTKRKQKEVLMTISGWSCRRPRPRWWGGWPPCRP